MNRYWVADSTTPDAGSAGGRLSFRRIVPIPFAACVAALDNWQLTAPGGELRLGASVLCGWAEHDRHVGTCRIEVRLARGPLRPPLRMRLHFDRWSATCTALELIPCHSVRPSAAYFRAGHRLLDALTRTLPEHVPAQQHEARRAPSPAGRPAAG